METLTNEEHERLLLMSEHAIAPSLSSAAQAVLDAFMDSPVDAGNYYATRSRQIAAALRVAAEQAAPFSTNLRQNQIHQRLVAIAAELEGADAG